MLCVNRPLVGQGLLTDEVSRSHSDTPQSVRLLWMGDQPDAETSTWQHKHNQKSQTGIIVLGGSDTRNASNRATTDRAAKEAGREEYQPLGTVRPLY